MLVKSLYSTFSPGFLHKLVIKCDLIFIKLTNINKHNHISWPIYTENQELLKCHYIFTVGKAPSQQMQAFYFLQLALFQTIFSLGSACAYEVF